MRILWSLPILLALVLPQQARGQDEPSALGPVGDQPTAQWMPPTPEMARKVNERAAQPAKVRLGLRLTPFKKVTTRGRDGTVDTRYVPVEPLRHTLRARLNVTNHFFVGEWHIETVPVKWVKKTRHYELRLDIYRRYGAFGQLEENVGSVNLAGILEDQGDNVHVLIGVARKRLRDKFGNPYLDVVAGFSPGPTRPGPEVSMGDPHPLNPPKNPPPGYTGDLIRGRF